MKSELPKVSAWLRHGSDLQIVPSRDTIFWLIGAGVTLEVLGLGLDVVLHALDTTLAAREGVFSLNPGHLLFLTGLSVCIFGLLAGLQMGSRLGLWVGTGVLMVGFNVALLARGEALTPHTHAGTQHLHAQPDAGGATTYTGTEIKLTWAQLRQTDQMLERARNATVKYKNVSIALRDGYKQEGLSRRGEGAHFINRRLLEAGRFDLEHPTFLLYERQQDWGLELVGVGWLLPKAPHEDTPPKHLAPLAVWHYHDYPAPGVCTWPDGTVNAVGLEPCSNDGGRFWRQSPWMLHAWLFRPSPEGMFSLVNSAVKGPQLADVSDIVASR